jgi:ribosomal protein L27
MGLPGDLAYEQLQKITLSKAKKLGLKGFEYQAIIWGSIQNNF